MSFARNPSRLPSRVAQPGRLYYTLLTQSRTLKKHKMLRYGRNRSSTESRYGVLHKKVAASVDVRYKREKTETAAIT